MRREELLESCGNEDIAHISYETAAWYKSIFLQAIRFAEINGKEVNSSNVFKLPYKDYNSMPFIVERHYLIISMGNFTRCLDDLNLAMLKKNDTRLDGLYKDILEDSNKWGERIKQLRNENEHKNEYRLNSGNKQNYFQKEISTELGKIETNGHWSVGVKGDYFIGDINIEELLRHLRSYREELVPLLERIVEDYWIK